MDFVLIAGSADRRALPKGVPVVVSPSRRGLILFRTLINDEARFGEIDRVRRQAKCGTLPPQR